MRDDYSRVFFFALAQTPNPRLQKKKKKRKPRGACALMSRAMGGVWTPSLWQPAISLSLGFPDASSKRDLLGRRRSHVPAVAAAGAGASPGLHLGDAEPGRELRQQQEPAAALVLEGEAGAGPGKSSADRAKLERTGLFQLPEVPLPRLVLAA